MPYLQTEIEKRLCQVTAKHRNHTVCLTINFPITYPRQHTPVFKFAYGTTIDYACKADLLKVGVSLCDRLGRIVCLQILACILRHWLSTNNISHPKAGEEDTEVVRTVLSIHCAKVLQISHWNLRTLRKTPASSTINL